MRLSLLLQSAGYCLPAFAPDMEVSGISLKIEDAVPGSVFVCVKGRHYDSHADALTAGKLGCFVVGETKTAGVDLPVENARSAAARLCAAYWNHPERRMRLIGVTGTNGKTTTAYLLQTLLSGGYIGTLGAVFGGKTVPFPGTTPEPSILYPLLADMADAGVSDAVMEVSSQALAQRRTDGVRFALGIFLNLSRDHLDYHGSMEDYFSAKCRLAEQSESLLVNADDAYGRRMLSLPFPARPYTFARRNAADADFVLTPGECGLAGSSFTLIDRTDGEKETFFLPLIGEPLRDDAAAAVCAAKLAKGVSFAAAAKMLKTASPVPGRAEPINVGAPFTVLRDYAHTPDALTRLFAGLNRMKGKGRLIAVYGCGGDRDAGKRPLMAKAGLLADVLILTSDNPRSEDPIKILQDMKKGLPETAKCSIIGNRVEAIRFAMETALPGDIVALCGKGHETYQLVGEKRLPMDETQIVRRLAAEREPYIRSDSPM